MKPANRSPLYALMAGLIMLETAGPALAQPVQEEDIVVTGRYGVPESAQTASQRVSYADLDLSLKSGRDELRHRVALTARYLCDQLGENDTADGEVPSCRSAACRHGSGKLRPRGTAWGARSPWKAPYPSDWAARDP